jgi:hypothetical protein
MNRHYDGPTYHGTPSLKPAPWTWEVPLYVALNGMAGSAQVIAAAARLAGDDACRRLARDAAVLGLAGAALGGPLLIADLKTPQRWYNMLRILRPTSPMSVGSYVLLAFGASSAIATAGHAAAAFGGGRAAQVGQAVADAALLPCAISGALMGTYTAALLTATSNPIWSAAPGALAVRFGASAMASGASALALTERAAGASASAGRLETLAALATATGLAASVLADARYRRKGVAGAQHEPAQARRERSVLALAYGAPLACHAVNALRRRPSPALAIAAGLASIAGSWLMRDTVFRGGSRSAQRPRDALGFARPAALPARRGRTRLQRSAEGLE